MRLSHLSAAAVLVALVAAMFVSLGSVRAQEADTSCGSTKTLMLAEPDDGDAATDEQEAQTCTIAQAIGGNADITVSGAATAISLTGGTGADLTITAAAAGTATLKVKWTADSPARTTEETTHVITVVPHSAPPAAAVNPSLKIRFPGDSDDNFGTGGSVAIAVDAVDVNVTQLQVNGGLDFYRLITTTSSIGIDNPNTTNVTEGADYEGAVSQVREPLGSNVYGTDDILIATNDAYSDRDDDRTTSTADDTNPDGPTGANVASQTLTKQLFVALPAGTKPGEYRVTAIGTYMRNGRSHGITAARTITVGDVGEVDSADLVLSSPRRAVGDDVDKVGGGADGKSPDGYADDASTSERSAIDIGSANNVELSLRIRNTLGKPSEASAISSIVVSTTNGTLTAQTKLSAAGSENIEYTCDSTPRQRTCEVDISSISGAGNPVPANIRLLLAAAETPGSASVTAVIIDSAGKIINTEAVDVSFVGPAASLSIGDASGTVLRHDVVGNSKAGNAKALGHDGDTGTTETPNGDADSGANRRDQISFTLSAADAKGTNRVVPDVAVAVTDPDGKRLSTSGVYQTTQTGLLNHTLSLDIDKSAVTPLKTGVYTIKVSAGTLSDTTTFTVVGPTGPEGVALSVDDDAPSMISGKVTATVEITDADGNAVANGTRVRFDSRDTTGDSDSVLVLASDEYVHTKAGMAKATFVVIGAGSAVVTATADEQVNVAVVTSTAGAPEPAPEPEPEEVELSLACLSEQSGFTTLICDLEASASEIFGLVSGRGATAIHLWNGSAWVRYSVVDGEEVPGSSDFMATRGDVLYISN